MTPPPGRHRHPEWGVGQYDPDAPQATDVVPVPFPTDQQVLARLVHGHPDAAVDALVDKLAGRNLEEAEARAALYSGVQTRPGGVPPRWGCAIVSHELLGWCSNCPDIVAAVELMAWRLVAAGHAAPDLGWALAVSADG